MPLCFCESYGCSSAGGTDLTSIHLRGRMLILVLLKSIQSPTDKPLFVQLRRILKLPLTPRSKKSPLIFQQVYSQIEFPVCCRALAAPFGRDMTILRDRLPQEKPIAASKRAHSRLLTPTPLAAYNSRPTSLHPPARQASSRRSREDGILASLANIEVEVDALYRGALNSLAHLGQPPSSGPPSSFSLADLFLLSKDLKSKLEIITFKGPAVLKLKDSIFLKLKIFDHNLMTAKTF